MRLFGTDGVRGTVNKDITPELALRLGKCAGTWARGQSKTHAVIARDTRRSGPMLGAAIAAGLCRSGLDVYTLGVAPTPAVAFATKQDKGSLGVVISASHNPPEDNGIKFLVDGRKLW
ncbi:MAG: hypothetical protein QXI19_09325, partial [Candidatus Caldarchaeum sp.]